MGKDAITALLITGGLGLVVSVMAVVLLLGKGGGLIAGFNTMPAEERERYDERALCRFMGKILLPIGLLMPCVALSGIYGIGWLGWLYGAAALGLVIFAAVWCNTGNRFRK